MNEKKLILAALSASLLLGASVAEGFARPRHTDHADMAARMPEEVIFVHMLKRFDTDKDGKITRDELKAGVDKLFDTIDTNKDGSITPGELRAYAKEKMKERQEALQKAKTENRAEEGKPEGDMHRHDKEMGQKGMDEGHRPGMGMHGMRHRPMRAMLFRYADTDENGQISKQEAQAAAEKLFARMDQNKDNVISIDDMPDW